MHMLYSLMQVLFVVPQLSDKKEIQLEVIPTGNADSKVSTAFVLGESVFELDRSLYCVNGEYTLVATVTNKGAEKGSGTIEIFDCNNPETVYESFTFTELANDEILNYDTTINNLNWDEVSYMKLGIMMNCYDIENIYVTGLGNGGGHAWNMVGMDDGKYYWLDATWDDQPYKQFQHDYFLVGDQNFTDHIADSPEGTGANFLYALPEASDVDYVYDPNAGSEETLEKGDINGDSNINLVDLMLCLNHVGSKELLEGKALLAADINNDDTVNLVDLMRLLNYVGGKSDSL